MTASAERSRHYRADHNLAGSQCLSATSSGIANLCWLSVIALWRMSDVHPKRKLRKRSAPAATFGPKMRVQHNGVPKVVKLLSDNRKEVNSPAHWRFQVQWSRGDTFVVTRDQIVRPSVR